MKLRPVDIAGWYGALAILAAYVLNAFAVLTVDDPVYHALNLTGAAGIVAVSAAKRAYQPAVLNAVWAAVAVVALLGFVLR